MENSGKCHVLQSYLQTCQELFVSNTQLISLGKKYNRYVVFSKGIKIDFFH